MKKSCRIVYFLFLLLSIGACAQINTERGSWEYAGNSRIKIEQCDDKTIEDLAILCKVWGFLKYYHPIVATGKYNWDYELFKIMPSVLKSTSITERNRIFYRWVKELGNVKQLSQPLINAQDNVRLHPDYSWINADVLSTDVVQQLEAIKNAIKSNEHYYIELMPNVGNPVFKNEEAYDTISCPDTGYRLLTLFRYWNIIQYYFPYKDLIGENWHDVLKEFIPKFVDAKSEPEYKLVVSELITRVHDTHASIWGMDRTLDSLKGKNIALPEITFLEGKATVVGFYKGKAESSSPLKIGDVILKVNGEPVDSIIGKMLPYTPGSNYPTQLRNISINILRINSERLPISYNRKGIEQYDTLTCYPFWDIMRDHFQTVKNKPWYQLLDGNISYIFPAGTKNLNVPYDKVLQTKGIIVDLRCYPSSSTNDILNYNDLMPDAVSFASMTVGSVAQPGLFVFKDTLKVGSKNEKYYKNKIVILVNERTLSHAEFSAMIYQCAPNAIVVGSATAGADGNISEIILPGGIKTAITGIGIYYPDGKETQRVGIIPDIEVRPTITGVREGRDEALDKAIELIRDNKATTSFLHDD